MDHVRGIGVDVSLLHDSVFQISCSHANTFNGYGFRSGWILIIVVFVSSVLLQLYFLQKLITIWKEINGKDEYTPFLTNPSSSNDFVKPTILSGGFSKFDSVQDESDSKPMDASSTPSFQWK